VKSYDLPRSELLILDYILSLEIRYVIALMLVCERVLVDTQNTTKTLAYLPLVFFVLSIGMIIYFSFGLIYSIRKMYDKRLMTNENLQLKLEKELISYSKGVLKDGDGTVRENKKLVNLILKENLSPLTNSNNVKLLINGEEKFPDVLEGIAH